MKIVAIVGARPQFIKHSPVYRALEEKKLENGNIETILVHTGQHYDYQMSEVFFKDFKMPIPNYNLGVGSNTHGKQTGAMLDKIETVLSNEAPDWVIVYGDTNSTLAGALAAAKLNIPAAHVEAGLRSFNRRMPEEINRVVTDHVTQLHLCPTETAVQNLNVEGIIENVHLVGDVMLDVFLYFSNCIQKENNILSRNCLSPFQYCLLTIHRQENTDHLKYLKMILNALAKIEKRDFVFPCHPRTYKRMKDNHINLPPNIKIIEPVSYPDMLVLEKYSEKILTDSGGIQKEAYFQKRPCISLREETEWKETVESGWNILVGTDPNLIVQAVETFNPTNNKHYSYFGDGKAASRIVNLLVS